MSEIKLVSIVIPLFNEAGNIGHLLNRINLALSSITYDHEILVINDGSTDGSEEILAKLKSRYQELKIINFKRNFGQTAAIMAGFDYAKGDIIITMDADLQNDPEDIINLIKKIEEGYDVVSGWRVDRKDHKFKRNFLSKIANKIISFITGLNLHDYGCTLKAYRKSYVKSIKLYGEMHRFIVFYTHLAGAKITEIAVKHHARVSGSSKYGMERIFKVIVDLMVVKYLDRYLKKPIYLFGGIGFILFFCSFSSIVLAIFLKFFRHVYLIQTPLPLFSAMTFITSVMCFLMGFLAEMIMRTYFESQDKKSYIIKDIIENS